MEAHLRKHVDKMEAHYRGCACRSRTPFFSKREHEAVCSHVYDPLGTVYRTLYQHDRDKILYSPSFRKLRLKTQVFPEHAADRFRTRLDHTLEVAQIARHLARQLRLNEDLVDAIALAHDICHTPFGHSGERALHRYLKDKGLDGLKHNWQGLRLVDKLEPAYPKTPGLNLTRAVRIGIVKHTGLSYNGDVAEQRCTCDMTDELEEDFDPKEQSNDIIEVQLVQLADEFAQLVHDFEDALGSGIITLQDIVRPEAKYPLIDRCITELGKKCIYASDFDLGNEQHCSQLLARIRSELIFQLTVDAKNT
ncbi:MAG: deoxyguanosinetriphosphate triphosphohydrolase family protein, partial [Planctomycetota bacterium]